MSLDGIHKLPTMTNAEIAADIAKRRSGTALIAAIAIIVGAFIFSAIILPALLRAQPINSGDANGSGSVTMSDVVFLINYIFGGGQAPAICPATLMFNNRVVEEDTVWIKAKVGDRIVYRGGDWYRLVIYDSTGFPPYWMATPDTISWGELDLDSVSMNNYFLRMRGLSTDR